MSKWNVIIDVAKCSNCNNCTMALKDEYVGNEFPGYSAAHQVDMENVIRLERHSRGNGSMVDVNYLPKTCNHCDNAPCVTAGKGAVTKRDDGIVIIDPVKAKGRRDLVDSCPYGSIVWNEKEDLPQNWIFDAHLLDKGWKQTRIDQVCGTGAFKVLKVSDEQMQSFVKADNLQVLSPELGTKPRVYYKNLEPTQSWFLGGNVSALGPEKLLENVEGAEVTLTLGSQSFTVKTDPYGDFKIDGLSPEVTPFKLVVAKPGLGQNKVEGTFNESSYLGSIELK